jgi:hypothetical protein
MADQGWMVDDGPDEDDIWDDDPFLDAEPYEPDCCDLNGPAGCVACRPRFGRERRREARRWHQIDRRQRQRIRHANDRFWVARNRPNFDDELSPF